MKTITLLRNLAKYFPKKIAIREKDYVGLMCGKLKEETHKIFLCLDFDKTLYDKVKDGRYDLIITHHPFIYGKKSIVFKYDEAKKELYEAMEKVGTPIYSMHTNFDEGKNGMNDALSEALELKDIHSVEEMPMMRVGKLSSPMEVEEFAKYAKEKLNVPYVALINEGKKMIETVSIIGGGGSRAFSLAQKLGFDIYISGDAPHHVRRDIVISGYNYLDVPHEVENIFMSQMKKVLLSIDPSLKIDTIVHEIPPKIL